MARRWLAATLVLAACGGSGGELADETLRRSAEQALDSVEAPPAEVPVDTAYRLPAFLDSPVAAVPAGDSAAPAAPVGQEWTVGVTERGAATGAGITTVRDVRVGRNEGFDRVVVGFGSDPVPAYRIEYAPPPVTACGSGEPVALEGSAVLQVRLRMSQAHDDAGRATVGQRDIRAEMPALRQVRLICDFEGEVTLALGVAGSRPYRVMVQGDPSRLIVDVRQ